MNKIMANLITYAQQQLTKPISANKEDIYDQLAGEVQERDLKKLLGVLLYQDLVYNPTDAKYVTLLEGGTFTVGSHEYTQKGLRYLLAYFIYGEYVIDSRFFDTFSGFIKQNIDESDRCSYGELKDKQKRAREIAFLAWEEIKLFLDNNTTIYTKWSCTDKRKLYTPIITKI